MGDGGPVPVAAPIIDGVAGHRLPWRELWTETGRRLDLRWSRTSWVVLVTHGHGCPDCGRLLEHLATLSADLRAWDAAIVAIVPPGTAGLDAAVSGGSSRASAPAGGHDHVDAVADGDGRLRTAAGLDGGQVGLLVADRFGVVWNAEVRRDHDLPDDAELVTRARYLAIQCPECETLDDPVHPDWASR